MRWVAWLLLAGCNGLLGLDPTLDVSLDIDRDGISNANDNCPTIANSDQLDTDGEGVGDACDRCPDGLACTRTGATPTGIDNTNNCIDDGCEDCTLVMTGDEDGDGVTDGCDLCPPIPDGEQPDSDGDGVGDACDLGGVRSQERVMFDGFNIDGAPDAEHWIGPAWLINVGAAGSPGGNAPLTLRDELNGGEEAGDWSIVIGVDAEDLQKEAMVDGNAEVNEVSITVANATGNATCVIRKFGFGMASQWELLGSSTDMPVLVQGAHGSMAPEPIVPFRMSLDHTHEAAFRCDAPTDSIPLIPSFRGPNLTTGPLEVTIRTKLSTRITYALVVD